MSGGLFGSLGVSASGMSAERLRMDVVAENLANANTTRGADGKPYKRQEVLLQQTTGPSFAQVLGGVQSAAGGVQVDGVVSDNSPGRLVYDPGHPDANAAGYVTMPNVDPVTEMTDLITANRGYEANVQALNAAKQMFTKTLDILR
jgi:flagellar basal-body rod protein FlgC